jgi:hypothetical protein
VHSPTRNLLAVWILLAALPLLAKSTETPAPAETPAATPVTTRIVGDDLRIPEVFTSHLPQTLKSGALRVSVHPHIGDFSARDYLRLTTGVRYGLTAKWEASASTEFYFSHGFGDVHFFKQVGLSTLNLGTKYDLGSRPIPGWNTAVGFDFATPVSRPPADLTDGMQHYNPYLTSSRRLVSNPNIRLFWGVGVDFVHHTDRPHDRHKNQLDDNATELTAGAVWDRHSLHYTFEVAWASTRLVGDSQDDTLTLRPGVIWEVPWFRARKSGRIILLGGALRASFGPDGTGLGAGAKLRINFDPKRHERSEPPPPAAP